MARTAGKSNTAEKPDNDLVHDVHARLDAALDHYRSLLHDSLNGLNEEEACRSLVPSKTTLLGLVKHVTYVETFYLQHCITGQPLQELGVASTPDRSFVLTDGDTIATIRAAHAATCQQSREAAGELRLGGVVRGPKNSWCSTSTCACCTT
jgi:ketopantoate reductase